MGLITSIIAIVIVLSLFSVVQSLLSNLYSSRLSKFPGPKWAAATEWWKTWIECGLNLSFCKELESIHAKYGKVVRIGPNELHFADPQAYQDIYNASNRWDKEPKLYHSFNEDRSSFGYLTYQEAKPRKDALNKLFSAKAIVQTQGIINDKIDALCEVIKQKFQNGQSIDLNLAFRCLTMDLITYLCFGRSVDAIHAKDFEAPIIVAMDASGPGFKYFRHFSWYKNMVLGCPPELSKKISPPTAGLVELQQQLAKQIQGITNNPSTLNELPHQMTIYHQLMNSDRSKGGEPPSAESMYEEAQALMFAGSDTSAAVLMVGFFELLRNPTHYTRLKQDVTRIWPDLSGPPPDAHKLEQLPFLNAVIKESLRLNSGVVSGLLRVVPPEGARIANTDVPGGTIVSCGSTFVSHSSALFTDPHSFTPERWLDDPSLDHWLVAFSKGPRSCLGINLAWLELRLAFAHLVRRFEMSLDTERSVKRLEWHDCFLPFYYGGHVWARMRAVDG